MGLVFQSYVYPTGYLTFPLDKRSSPRLGDQPPGHVSPLSGWVLPYPAGYGFPRPFGCVFRAKVGSWPLYVMSRRSAPASHTALMGIMSDAARAAVVDQFQLDRTFGVSTFS